MTIAVEDNGKGVSAADAGRITVTRSVLAAAHLDHDAIHNAGRNLQTLCQCCHKLHDRDEHRRQRWLTLRMRKALGDLFLGHCHLHLGQFCAYVSDITVVITERGCRGLWERTDKGVSEESRFDAVIHMIEHGVQPEPVVRAPPNPHALKA